MATISGSNSISSWTDAYNIIGGTASGQSSAYFLENILSNQTSMGDKDFRHSFIENELGIKPGTTDFSALDTFLEKLSDTKGFDTL